MIKKVNIEEINELCILACELFENDTLEELKREFLNIMNDGNAQFFMMYQDDLAIGFSQCQIRSDYVEGTSSGHVGYLEGVYIKKEYRKKGYGKELVLACCDWAKENGCYEFASDCQITNEESYLFHKALGFIEVNRIICFKKNI